MVNTIIFELQFQKGMAQIAAPCPIHRTTYSQKKNRLVEYQNLLLSLCGNTNNSAALFTNKRTWINTNNATWIYTDSATFGRSKYLQGYYCLCKVYYCPLLQ